MATIISARQLGSAVRAERKRRGITQVDLAERSGVSRAWLARFETGHPSASIEPLFRILQELGLGLTLTERRTSSAESSVLAALAAKKQKP